MLKPGRITAQEWAEDYFPLIERGVLKERKDLAPKGFLLVYQAWDTCIEVVETKQLFRVVAWCSPTEHYAEITKWRDCNDETR